MTGTRVGLKVDKVAAFAEPVGVGEGRRDPPGGEIARGVDCCLMPGGAFVAEQDGLFGNASFPVRPVGGRGGVSM